MKRLKKSNDDETVDRLSSLPESLIFEILSFLETKDVVRTSILSKEWKDLWTTIPYLEFNDSMENPVRTQNLIDRVLQRWKGTKILRFKISLRNPYDDASFSKDMARWAAVVVEKKVEDLDLHFPLCWGGLELPDQCLFSCSSITKLRLIGCRFPTDGGNNMHWGRLKSLEIDCEGLNEEFIHQLVSSAPQLQVLKDLSFTIRHQTSLIIRSNTLKRLTLSADFRGVDPSTFTLWAPNLEQFTMILYAPRMTHFLFDVPALTDFSLYNLLYSQVVETGFKQLCLCIQHVEALTLDILDYKRFELMEDKCLFPNVKILKLVGAPIRPNDIVDVADIFPNVEKLIMQPSGGSRKFS